MYHIEILRIFSLLHFVYFGYGLKKDEGWNYINLHCRDNFNIPVDWWYMYKPAGEAAPYDDSGRNFSYIISDIISRWRKPDRHITTNNMLYHTLAPMYRGTYINRVAFMVFDESDPNGTNPGAKARGILMADEVGGIFISHSVPDLIDVTNIDRPKFPESELINGHLLSCMTMDVDALNEIAMLIRHIGASVTLVHVPKQLQDIVPTWANERWDSGRMGRTGRTALSWHKDTYGPLEFLSRESGLHVLVLYRTPGDNVCLYRTFARRQGIVIDVYSPGARNQKNICDRNYGVRSIDSISLKMRDEKVHYVKNKTDRTRYAVSTAASWQRKGRSNTQYWTCTSDLNLGDSTRKGGILICIDNYQVWSAFDNLKVKEPECD